MGIPSFWSRLTAAGYADSAKIIGRPGAQCHAHAIIDAPALAYGILRLLQTDQIHDANIAGRSPAPPYTECALRAIQWLDTLETHGFIIDGIFFDGALPASKRDTRIQRLTKCAHDLENCRRRLDHMPKGRSSEAELRGIGRAQACIAPPFLVQAVQEALLDGKYGDVTFCCPGEADDFCVAAARAACHAHPNESVAIFTSDSDLAVFDSGQQTRIVLLNTFELGVDTTGAFAAATQYWPWDIARKLEVSNLIPLAWFMSQNPRDTVPKIVCANLISDGAYLQDSSYHDFAKLYAADVTHTLLDLQSRKSRRQLLLGLDARVAELVHQTTEQTGLTSTSELEIFLPFLLEDSSRASAWRIGSNIRDAAYSILLKSCDRSDTAVLEFKRSSNGISARKSANVHHSAPSNMLDATHKRLKSPLTSISSRTTAERWRFAIMQSMLADFEAEGMSFPLPAELLAVVTGEASTQWHVVHLSAQYQAAFYSLRMLLQIMRYVKQTEDSGPSEDMYTSQDIFRLPLEVLEGMPGISDFFQPSSVTNKDWVPDIEGFLQALDPAWVSPRTEAKRKRKKAKHKQPSALEARSKKVKAQIASSGDQGRGSTLASNPFAALLHE
ncbi:hypothetical protein LTR53_006772 [Teratosphaeriaceae sp. CCFEE 6253]|nr:hypothetical protein LTR53_006772 [Teratosphaeriaceae sp. CCFEE 6253]